MQIYAGLTVGTAAPLPDDHPDIKRHLVGFLPPDEPFSVADYVAAARGAILNVQSRGGLPVVCGGTGLYLSSLLRGLDFGGDDGFGEARAALSVEWEQTGGAAMLARLAEVDPAHADKLHVNDKKRIINALAHSTAAGDTYQARKEASLPEAPPYRALCIGLDARERSLLYARIGRRVDMMLAAGLLDEARRVWEHRAAYKTAAQAIGYKEFFPYFAGEAPLADCAAKLKQATRNYAKRQLTWFRRMEDIHWLYLEDGPPEDAAARLVEQFLQGELCSE